MFDALFYNDIVQGFVYLADFQGFWLRTRNQTRSILIKKLLAVKRALLDDRPLDFQSCVYFAQRIWEQEFHDKIEELRLQYPTHLTVTGKKYLFV